MDMHTITRASFFSSLLLPVAIITGCGESDFSSIDASDSTVSAESKTEYIAVSQASYEDALSNEALAKSFVIEDIISTRHVVEDIISTRHVIEDIISTQHAIEDIISTYHVVEDIISTKHVIEDIISTKHVVEDIISTRHTDEHQFSANIIAESISLNSKIHNLNQLDTFIDALREKALFSTIEIGSTNAEDYITRYQQAFGVASAIQVTSSDATAKDIDKPIQANKRLVIYTGIPAVKALETWQGLTEALSQTNALFIGDQNEGESNTVDLADNSAAEANKVVVVVIDNLAASDSYRLSHFITALPSIKQISPGIRYNDAGVSELVLLLTQ